LPGFDFEKGDEGMVFSHVRVRETGGGEWESNPPGTVSRPHPDLKSGRPTGDDSLPLAAVSAGEGPKRSSRWTFSRRRSPRRSVTPCRSKNSKISIETFRPFSNLSRRSAA